MIEFLTQPNRDADLEAFRAILVADIAADPAIKRLIEYAANAEASDPGEGDYDNQEAAFCCGSVAEQFNAAEKIRAALTALGLEAPAGQDEVCFEGEGWQWLMSHQRAALNQGWQLTMYDGDGSIDIEADEEGHIFTGDGAHARADAHVHRYAVATSGVRPEYQELCQLAVRIQEATAPEDEPELPAVPTPADHCERGMEHLRQAREAFEAAGAPKTLERVRAAISSADGARRHAQLEPFRTERQTGN